MDKKNVVSKFENKVNTFGNLLAEVLMTMAELPAGSLNEVAADQLVSYLRYESAGLWATVELMGMLNKSGGSPFNEQEMEYGFRSPAHDICVRKEEVIWDLQQAVTMHKMYRCI